MWWAAAHAEIWVRPQGCGAERVVRNKCRHALLQPLRQLLDAALPSICTRNVMCFEVNVWQHCMSADLGEWADPCDLAVGLAQLALALHIPHIDWQVLLQSLFQPLPLAFAQLHSITHVK